MDTERFRQESARGSELYWFPVEHASPLVPRVEIEPVWKRARIRLLLIRLDQTDQWEGQEIELECNSRCLMISPEVGNVLHRWNRENGGSYFSMPWKRDRLRVLLSQSGIIVE